MSCYIAYGINAEEYILFDFIYKTHRARMEWLGDSLMDSLNMNRYGANWKNVFNELRNKKTFYELTKKFFHRDVLCFTNQTLLSEINEFVKKNNRFIAKPLCGTMGGNTHIVRMNEFTDVDDFIKCYRGKSGDSEWIFEKLIEQPSDFSQWNLSSVNTVRIPSFRKENPFDVIFPFIRTGRKGSVVDNGGQGGIFASIDVRTGKICSDGADEQENFYTCHPDSQIKYDGWQIPKWEELLKLSAEIHKSLPKHHKYVAFDFALTLKGWILIEGNWGQFICQQLTLKRGLRREFEKSIAGN